MPLLALFTKKGKSSSKASVTGYSNSNISLDDGDYVSVTAPSPVVYRGQAQVSTSSSKLVLPFRKKPEQAALRQQPHLPYSDPLLEPPPRRSSLFQAYQDNHNVYRSTQSLPSEVERPFVRPQTHPNQHHGTSQLAPSTPPTKKSIFSWSSHKERAKSVPSAKSGPSATDDPTFNLMSFRHVRPESPDLGALELRAPSPSPAVPPIPTSNLPSPPISFQVTSRRPRGNSDSENPISVSSSLTASQQKMAAGAFRQAARRSTTSLSLTDSPILSPVRTSLDDRPPPSLLQSQPTPGTPPRPPRPQPPPTSLPYPSNSVTSSSNLAPTSSPPKSVISSFPRPISKPALRSAPRARTNAFTNSSSSSSSEDEEQNSDFTSDDGGGTPHISRRGTIRQGQSRVRAPTLPPLSSSVREQVQRATPPTSSSPGLQGSLFPVINANDMPSASSSTGVYSAGTRPRASLSAGALSPSAKDARASTMSAANSRLANTTYPTPKATSRSLVRSACSDTSESAESVDSDEDAPLSSLVPPRRPGTSTSSHSAPSILRKPLVDLDAPSSLTGRPVKSPPPLARDEDPRQRPKVHVETNARVRTPPVSVQQNTRKLQTSHAQNSRVLQGPSTSNMRISHTQSSHTVTSLDTPTTPSFSGSSGQLSSFTPSGSSGSRLSSVGSKQTLPPVAPPLRPFARRESPASSTGDSSSGKAPLTPHDGTDTRRMYSGPSAKSVDRGRQVAHSQGHGRKASVTFEDEQEAARERGKQKDNGGFEEVKRKERRRSEARAAIELGNVVNGPPPVDEDDIALGQQRRGIQAGWPQPGIQIPMPPVPPMFNMNMAMPSPGGYGMAFPPSSPNADPAFLAAHQQAMAIAKQTFQYAVAQQALAAANDEWERSSNMTGFSNAGLTPQWGGYGVSGIRQNTVFPAAPQSMYAGSVGGYGGGAWGGTGSVYGDAFGPSAAGTRNSTYSQVDLSAGTQRPVRPRTRTAPSAASPPSHTSAARMPAPPSSFRGTGR